jgi:hypothetical protein
MFSSLNKSNGFCGNYKSYLASSLDCAKSGAILLNGLPSLACKVIPLYQTYPGLTIVSLKLPGLTKVERLCYTPCGFRLKDGIIQYVVMGYKVAPGNDA